MNKKLKGEMLSILHYGADIARHTNDFEKMSGILIHTIAVLMLYIQSDGKIENAQKILDEHPHLKDALMVIDNETKQYFM